MEEYQHQQERDNMSELCFCGCEDSDRLEELANQEDNPANQTALAWNYWQQLTDNQKREITQK